MYPTKNADVEKGCMSKLAAIAESIRQLWGEMPDVCQHTLPFITDLYDSYVDVIPEKQHVRVIKKSCLAKLIERFNCKILQAGFSGW